MTELQKIKPTKKQAAELNECIKNLKHRDYSWELREDDRSFLRRAVLAYAAGYLWRSTVPYSVAYAAIDAFVDELWEKEKRQ